MHVGPKTEDPDTGTHTNFWEIANPDKINVNIGFAGGATAPPIPPEKQGDKGGGLSFSSPVHAN